MTKVFWAFVFFQVILVLAYSMIWPDSGLVWIMGLLGYLVFSIALIGMSTKLGKNDRTYYYVGLFGSYINWAIFGSIGAIISIVISTLGALLL